ncbi:4,5-DOPA dioxygenase extradiol [Novosphingobium decolorationis]|uniref:4,5-DOPA dioxygenase extradiol n=1 Tax=Novosphingobium decolorationis TaxID=2698673 RepID=A0ABX8E2X8_9SPHN|nr:4,5-DOPA dioxygenase extradiol [Novosphingobium decolorationis]QVM82541.1 4,5-DOPA dioxygenase extradiol [Novosphingobium decolorationis]
MQERWIDRKRDWDHLAGMTHAQPAFFIGHGSPMTMITDNPERRFLEALGPLLERPKAILTITAHWESQGTTRISEGEFPRTIHDFRGFPQELYDMQYPAPLAAELHDKVLELAGDIPVRGDASWGFDHGVWGVLRPLFPAADIPVLAMSVNHSLSPEQHLELARRLAPLRRDGVMIVGSGNVVHNLRLYHATHGTKPDWATAFQDRINAAVIANDHAALTQFARDDQAAANAINSGEHYLPLLYAVGARLPEDEVGVFNDSIDGALSMTSYMLGNPSVLNEVAAPAAA